MRLKTHTTALKGAKHAVKNIAKTVGTHPTKADEAVLIAIAIATKRRTKQAGTTHSESDRNKRTLCSLHNTKW